MAADGVWQSITALFSGLIIHGDPQSHHDNLPSSPSSQTFGCFSRLSAELRVKIWRYALPGPRLLRLVGYVGSERVLSSALSHPFHLLHVNKESRTVALKEYCILRDLSVAPIYIDPKIDLLCFLDFDQFQTFIRDRTNKLHDVAPVIDKFVIFGIAETKELNVHESMKDILFTSYSARFIYPDLRKVVFVLEGCQVKERLSQTLENEQQTREINEQLKGNFSDGIPLDLNLEFVTMEDLVTQYNVETDSELAA